MSNKKNNDSSEKKFGLFILAAITHDSADLKKCSDAGIEIKQVADGGISVTPEEYKKIYPS